jgi:hypothetical protein
MKKIISLLTIVSTFMVSGCDTWYEQRFDLTIPSALAFEIDKKSSHLLVGAIKQYALENELSCSQPDELPVECYKQPVHVWAASTENGAVVCYSAIGIPLEKSKFEAHINALKTRLSKDFSIVSVGNSSQCQHPHLFGN